MERIINEPSAAALAYHKGKDEDMTFLVVDFGGGTLDVSVVDAFSNVIEIIAVAGDNRLGGDDFNHAIAAHFCKQCGLSYPNCRAKRRQVGAASRPMQNRTFAA